jgi:hypothetical protein
MSVSLSGKHISGDIFPTRKEFVLTLQLTKESKKYVRKDNLSSSPESL